MSELEELRLKVEKIKLYGLLLDKGEVLSDCEVEILYGLSKDPAIQEIVSMARTSKEFPLHPSQCCGEESVVGPGGIVSCSRCGQKRKREEEL